MTSYLMVSYVSEIEQLLIWLSWPWIAVAEQSWPELVGKDQDTAYLVIRRDNPQVTDVVYLISDVLAHALDNKRDVLGAAGDGNFCCNRVVVVLGDLSSGGEGVVKVPKVG
jgi:hypothetical protein